VGGEGDAALGVCRRSRRRERRGEGWREGSGVRDLGNRRTGGDYTASSRRRKGTCKEVIETVVEKSQTGKGYMMLLHFK